MRLISRTWAAACALALFSLLVGPVYGANTLLGVGKNGSVATYVGPGDLKSGATAWFGLRAYSAAYAAPGNNPAIDVIRASDSTTLTINILTTGALDIASLNTFLAATTGKVSKMYDQTGNGHHATQATSGLQPPIATSGGPGSTVYLNFGSGAGGQVLATGNITLSQPFTFSTVYERYASFTSTGGMMGFGTGQITFEANNVANQAFIYAGNVVSASATDSVLNAAQVLYNGASSEFYINGTRTTGNFGTNAPSAQPFNVGDQGNGEHPHNYWLEGGVWPSAFSNADEVAINGNQRTFWGF